MLSKGLASDIRWFIVFFFAVVFIGMSFKLGREAAILACLSYIVTLFYRLRKLEKWMRRSRKGQPKADDFSGVWSEISEDVRLLAKRYEKDKKRLQAVVERTQDMTSALNDGVVLIDKTSHIEWWNSAATSLLGLRAVDKNKPITNILRDPLFQKYFQGKKFSEALQLESQRNEDQKLWFQLHPFGDGEKLLIVRDVTHMAKLEQMRRDFVANVSHELRTPLTVVRGYVETLMDLPDQPPILIKALRQIQQQGLRMNALVNDLITLTKLETNDRVDQLDVISLHNLSITVINDAMALSNDKQHTIVNDVDKTLKINGDEKELRSALSNLVVNAVRYNPQGCDIRISSEKQSNYICLHISDTGVGIDPKHIPRLTERFYRVDSSRNSQIGGTGLGLAIVKHVLIRHDALLKISSQLNKGSTFSCYFPIQRLITRGADMKKQNINVA